MADNDRSKRELALSHGSYAYILDGTKGSIRTHVGPCTVTLTNQDKPVKFNNQTFKFDDCDLEQAMQQSIVAPEGFYVELRNPAVSKPTGAPMFPEEGRPNEKPDFLVGEKVNIPGPATFALYPGQMADLRRGHHLHLNEFLRIKIYADDKARANWSKAVVKKTEGDAAMVAGKQPPSDLAVGKTYNIEGKDVSFYIPPTGVSVVPDPETGEFVRAAETLEQLEYSILVDEDGNKDYPRGPAVVFPKPTQRFLKDKEGNRKWRAVELNELQGIQLKFTKEVELTYADGTKHPFHAGEEAFITGAALPIYFPEEGHQLVRYDGKTIHYAVAVPDGEARYVMNRKTGEIETVQGPTMLLPNPVTHIIVRRALSDAESIAMFPGADGTGSREALAYNQWLRSLAAKETTTRQGVVGEGSVDRAVSGGAALMDWGSSKPAPAAASANFVGGFEAIENMAQPQERERGVGATRRVASKSAMAESRQGKAQEAVVADVAERKSNYHEPRTLTFANGKGVPPIRVQQGYAVQVADSDGNRRVVEGPKTIFLQYAETLDVLKLSTGKPKCTEKLFATAYLNISNNKITDILQVETLDHVTVTIKLIYNVNFEGDKSRWFGISNYVKYLCDHARSVLKGHARKLTIEEFYKQPTHFIRDYVLGLPQVGTQPAAGTRPGMRFEENGMRVTDVEVLAVEIADRGVAELLSRQQREVVEQNIHLAQARMKLDATKANEDIKRQEAEAAAQTEQSTLTLREEMLKRRVALALAEIASDIQLAAEKQKKQEADETIKDFAHEREIGRKVYSWEVEDNRAKLHQERSLAELQARTTAIVEQMKGIAPDLAAALTSTSANETLIKVAEKLSFQSVFGGENAVDMIRKVFNGNPMQGVLDKAIKTATALAPNGSEAKSTPRVGA